MSSDVTQVLDRIQRGEQGATSELLPLVYDELRRLATQRMAREQPDHTLQPTALVHEAYLRLTDGEGDKHWDNREHFFCAAAEAMRRILIDSARSRQSLKRGGGGKSIEFFDAVDSSIRSPDLLIDLEEALTEFSTEDRVAAELVKLRIFAGFSTEAAGEILGMSRATAFRTWEFARSWFAVRLGPSER